MKCLSIRWKLTLWYSGVLAVVLAVSGTTVFLTMRHEFLERIDKGLAEELAEVLSEVRRADEPKILHQWLERSFARHEGFDFQVTEPNGEKFFVSQRLEDKALPVPVVAALSEARLYESVPIGESGRWRIVCVCAKGPTGPLTVQVARSLSSYEHEMHELLFVFLVTTPLTLLVAVGAGYFLAGRALAPVQRMTQTANQISADRLSERIAVGNPDDELGVLCRRSTG